MDVTGKRDRGYFDSMRAGQVLYLARSASWSLLKPAMWAYLIFAFPVPLPEPLPWWTLPFPIDPLACTPGEVVAPLPFVMWTLRFPMLDGALPPAVVIRTFLPGW